MFDSVVDDGESTVKKGRHRRYEEARNLKRGPDLDIEALFTDLGGEPSTVAAVVEDVPRDDVEDELDEELDEELDDEPSLYDPDHEDQDDDIEA